MIIEVGADSPWLSHHDIQWATVGDVASQPLPCLGELSTAQNVPTATDLIIRDLADGEARALALADRVALDHQVLREILSVALEQLAHATAHLHTARRTITVLRAAERAAA